MNIGNIVEPNSKGQIVIPKKIRDNLGISPGTPLNMVVRDDIIHLYPVKEVTTNTEVEIARKRLLIALEKTRGAWADEDWEVYDKKERQRRKQELESTRKLKKSW